MTHIHINSNVLLFDTFNIYILIILRNETIRIGRFLQFVMRKLQFFSMRQICRYHSFGTFRCNQTLLMWIIALISGIFQLISY